VLEFLGDLQLIAHQDAVGQLQNEEEDQPGDTGQEEGRNLREGDDLATNLDVPQLAAQAREQEAKGEEYSARW